MARGPTAGFDPGLPGPIFKSGSSGRHPSRKLLCFEIQGVKTQTNQTRNITFLKKPLMEAEMALRPTGSLESFSEGPCLGLGRGIPSAWHPRRHTKPCPLIPSHVPVTVTPPPSQLCPPPSLCRLLPRMLGDSAWWVGRPAHLRGRCPRPRFTERLAEVARSPRQGSSTPHSPLGTSRDRGFLSHGLQPQLPGGQCGPGQEDGSPAQRPDWAGGHTALGTGKYAPSARRLTASCGCLPGPA